MANDKIHHNKDRINKSDNSQKVPKPDIERIKRRDDSNAPRPQSGRIDETNSGGPRVRNQK